MALSYCWGDINNKTWLNCSGRRLALTKNLLDAIRRLRRKDKTIILWIDQICINQEDLEERSSQVLLMQQIYKNATNVLIWLGDKADDSNMALDLIPRLSGTLGPELKSRSIKDFQAVKALLSRPWFGRMWILQELGAASSATMMCGKKSIPWQDVSNLIDHIRGNLTLRILVFGTSESSLLACRRLENLKSFRERFLGREFCFFSALCMSRSFDATDPRDKIFALVGCCNQENLIQPDYSIDTRRLYQAIAHYSLFRDDSEGSADPSNMCREDFGMRFLCEAERIENTYDLPSWVPDWRARLYPSLWKDSSEIDYNAAGTSKTRIALVDNSKLSLAGKIGDAVYLISSIAPPADDGSFPLFVSSNWRDGLFQRVPQSCWITEASSIAATCQRYRENASRDAAFGTTLAGNNTVYDTSSHRHTEFALYYWHFRQFLSILCPNGVVNGASFQQLSFILNEHLEGYHHFDLYYQTAAQGRRFFTTLSGYMGIGPPHMRSGDLVCVFLGGNVPWVIRQDGLEYSLVGECYVHGIMNGEFMKTENLPVKDIIVK